MLTSELRVRQMLGLGQLLRFGVSAAGLADSPCATGVC
jgi:hypothetical protein